MEGYFLRIWKQFGVDKAASVNDGVFIVRFTFVENRDKVLKGGFHFFDKKNLMLLRPGHLM